MKLKIGIDLDNVLNNLTEKWLESYNKDHNDNVSSEDIKGWYLHEYVKIGKGIYKYLNNDLFQKLEPIEYAIEITKKLSKEHELFIITATSMKHMKTKSEWLNKYFSHIPKHNIFTCFRKDLVNVDILIDDAPHNIVNFPNKVIIFNQPWNKHLKGDYTRVDNWKEIYDVIDTITKTKKESW